MLTINLNAYINNLKRWLKHSKNIHKIILEEFKKEHIALMQHFNNWKMRNIDNVNKPKSKGDDIHKSFIEQLKWLSEIGFKNTDLFIKYHLWCMIGGQK